MAKCSHCLHWDACSMLFAMAIGRKPTANGNKAEEKCPHFKDKTINTNADRIRAMSDEELAEMIVKHHPMHAWNKQVREIYFGFDDHRKDNPQKAWLECLKQPAEDALMGGYVDDHNAEERKNKRINELPLATADLIDEDSCTVTLQGWIFTKDAQPSEAGMYLAFADSLFPKGKPRIGTYYWTGSDWLDILHIPRKVSHWMPLPDPPEGIWL